MSRYSVITSFVVASVCLSAACNRGEPVPPAEVQSQVAQPANQPIAVRGCLKAGEASDTFVLTAARSEGSNETATYVLVGKEGVNLRDHIGRQVEVNGVVRAEQEMASRSGAQPADKATGTAGTPTVQTRTQVELKRLDVSAIKPTGDRCES
jgi:hypothetical protein